MNILEVSELIESIPSVEIKTTIFYKKKRAELLVEINKDLKTAGLPGVTLEAAISIARM